MQSCLLFNHGKAVIDLLLNGLLLGKHIDCQSLAGDGPNLFFTRLSVV